MRTWIRATHTAIAVSIASPVRMPMSEERSSQTHTHTDAVRSQSFWLYGSLRSNVWWTWHGGEMPRELRRVTAICRKGSSMPLRFTQLNVFFSSLVRAKQRRVACGSSSIAWNRLRNTFIHSLQFEWYDFSGGFAAAVAAGWLTNERTEMKYGASEREIASDQMPANGMKREQAAVAPIYTTALTVCSREIWFYKV